MKVDIKVGWLHPTNAELRSWALRNGHYVAERGRISHDVKTAFWSAHEQALATASERFLAEAGMTDADVQVRTGR